MLALLICITLAVIAILMIILSCTPSIDGVWGFIGMILLMFDGALGFGLVCTSNIESSSETQVEFSFAKTQSTVIIETPCKTQVFSDAYTYNRISDSSKVFLYTDYNVYGDEVHSRLIVK